MTKPPAMPELPEPELGYIETDKSNQPAFSARQMRAALQSAQPAAEVSDAEIDSAWVLNGGGLNSNNYRAFARAILALRPQSDTLCFELSAMLGCPPSDTDVVACVSSLLTPRPQAVPMTEADLLACVVKANCLGGVPMSNRNGHYHIDTPSDAVVRLKDAIESHHGITAPAGGVLHAAHQPAKEPSK